MAKNVKNIDTVVIDGVNKFMREGAPAATENKMPKNVKNIDTVVIEGVKFMREGAPAVIENKMPAVKNCYFCDNRTIVLWDDGTTTVVQCQPGDQFDPEKGIFAAIAKRAYGNTGKFNDVMRTANDMGEYNFIKKMAKNPGAMAKLIEDLFYGLADSDKEDDEDDVCDKSLFWRFINTSTD